MARFTRKVNKQNKTVTVTDQMTGESVTGRYHDSLSAEKTADLIEGDLVQKEARSRVSDETSTAMQTRQLQDQSGADTMSREGFLSRQRLLNSRTQPNEESALKRAGVGVSPPQTFSSPTRNVNQGEFKEVTLPNRVPRYRGVSLKPGQGIERGNITNSYGFREVKPDTPTETPIQRRVDPIQGKAAFMQMMDRKQGTKGVNQVLSQADERESLERALATEQGRGSFEDVLKPKKSSSGLFGNSFLALKRQYL